MHHSDLENLTTGPDPSDLSQLVHILQQPLDARSPIDNLFLWDTLEKIPFISSTIQHFDNKNEFLQEISALLKVETYPAQSVIRHFGDSVNRIHLVLQGQVRRYVPRSHEDIRNEQIVISGEASPFKFRPRAPTQVLTAASPSEELKTKSIVDNPVSLGLRARKSSQATLDSIESPTIKLKESSPSIKVRGRNASKTVIETGESPSLKPKDSVSIKTRTRHGSIMTIETLEPVLQKKGSIILGPEGNSPSPGSEENHPEKEGPPERVFNFIEEPVKEYSVATPEEVQFFKRLGQPKKYFSGNTLQFRFEKAHEPGEFLGGIAAAFNAPQGATLVAWEEVQLAYLSKEVYERVFKINIGETKEKVKFFRETLLQGYSSKACTNLAYGFQKQVNRREDTIFKEGTEAEGLWIIAEGEVELYKMLEERETKEKPESPMKPKKYKALVIRLSKGQFLGEESIVGEAEEREFTAIVKSSHSVLYYLDNRRLAQIGKYQKESFEILLKKAYTCMDLKMKRLYKAMKEANIVLSMPRMKLDDKDTEAKNKAKEAIDLILGGVKVLEEDEQDQENFNFNIKTVVKADKIAQDRAQMEHLEKMAGLKKKIVSSDSKIDMKLVMPAAKSTFSEAANPQISKEIMMRKPTAAQLIDMEKKNPKFYYPESFFNYLLSKDKNHTKKKLALERKLNLAHPPKEKERRDKSDSSRASISNTNRNSVREFIQRRLSIPIPTTFNTASQVSHREVTGESASGPNETPDLIEICSPAILTQRVSRDNVLGPTPDVSPILRAPIVEDADDEKYALHNFKYRLSKDDSPLSTTKTPELATLTKSPLSSSMKPLNTKHRLNSKSLSKLRINVVRDKLESLKKAAAAASGEIPEEQKLPESVGLPFPFMSGGEKKRDKRRKMKSIEGSIEPWQVSKPATLADIDAKLNQPSSPLMSAKKLAKDKMHIDLDEILRDDILATPQEELPIRVLNVLKVMTDRGDPLLPALKGFKVDTYRRSNNRGRTLQLFGMKIGNDDGIRSNIGGGSKTVRNVHKSKTRISEERYGRKLPSLERSLGGNMSVPLIGLKIGEVIGNGINGKELGLEVKKPVVTSKKPTVVS